MNKENKKVNDRELKLIFVLGGIVLFFLIYQFGSVSYTHLTLPTN